MRSVAAQEKGQSYTFSGHVRDMTGAGHGVGEPITVPLMLVSVIDPHGGGITRSAKTALFIEGDRRPIRH